jgi:hypothetical protein
VEDVVKMETQDDQLDQEQPPIIIPGVGPCRSVRLHLRPLHGTEQLRVPSYWQPAWERHVQRMSQNNAAHSQQQQPQQPASAKKDNDDGDHESEEGPILTFCLPTSQLDPPLLWKVHFPVSSSRPPIAIESLTVFEGCIQTRGNSASTGNNNTPETTPESTDNNSPHSPTHIYLQGYQSWSFAGSIAKGQEQPKSALPNVMSRAFNAGGAPPPDICTVVTNDDMNSVNYRYANHSDSGSSTDSDYANNGGSTRQQGQRQLRARTLPPRRKAKIDYCYQSDFFTCITSDGNLPNRKSSRQERQFPYKQLDEKGGPAVLLGWLSQHEQFGVITADKDLRHLQMHCSGQGHVLLPDRVFDTDWAYAQLVTPHSYDEEPMAQFLHCVAGHNHARPLLNGSLLTGWCSWYHYYENISADSLRENFAKLAAMRAKVPTNVAVVDDGYMTAWGDWDSLKPNKFPDGGMAVVAQDIALNGMRPGLWLAPFAADKHSKVVKEHPDWVIRNDLGLPANSSNCGKFFYGLDATNPAVREHVHRAVKRAVHDWKFNVLKIDFLYAACLEGNGKYDLSMSRAQAMHLALQTIRNAAGPDIFLIGCGCPVGTGVGFVDGMRVSADTGPTWYPALPLPWWDHGTLPCLRSMLRNSISRAPMGHRWWHNDPDCLLLGETTRLTDEEVASAASIVAMTCGMMLLSDDLTKVSLSRMRTLTKIFPMTGVTAVVLDLHCANDGLPSLLRLWCTENYDVIDTYRDGMSNNDDDEEIDHNAEATFFARQASFQPGAEPPVPNERKRSCIHVTKGLGTWTVVSLSNWSDRTALVHVPPHALLPPPETGWGTDEPDNFLDDFANKDSPGQHGYHVFAFWSSKYTWIPDHRRAQEHGPDSTISKKLAAHETEIFHSKPVTPHTPQYIGSDLHFSCGQEVRLFRISKNTIHISLKTAYNRVGHVFVFVPTQNSDRIRATVNGAKGRWNTVGNTPKVNENGSPRLLGRIIRIMVVVHADGSPHDGQIQLDF